MELSLCPEKVGMRAESYSRMKHTHHLLMLDLRRRVLLMLVRVRVRERGIMDSRTAQPSIAKQNPEQKDNGNIIQPCDSTRPVSLLCIYDQ